MARKKNEMKAKEPVKLRFKKLSNANQSIYLDIYYKGKRYYEFLKLYLTPERFPEDRDKNRITLRNCPPINPRMATKPIPYD